MIRRTMFVLLCAAFVLVVLGVADVQAQQAFDRQWGRTYTTQDWNRMYHYPYATTRRTSGVPTITAAARISTIAIRRKCAFRCITKSGRASTLRTGKIRTLANINFSRCSASMPSVIRASGTTRATTSTPTCFRVFEPLSRYVAQSPSAGKSPGQPRTTVLLCLSALGKVIPLRSAAIGTTARIPLQATVPARLLNVWHNIPDDQQPRQHGVS